MEPWKRNLLVCWFGLFAMATGTTQLTPILPVYIKELGVNTLEEVSHWSGIVFGVTFIVMAIFSPIWGNAADKYGRKPMLLRASFGMAIIIAGMGFVQNVYQLVALRILQGTVSGYYAAATTLVATQTPPGQTGWALGTLSTAAVSGMLVGPLFGGYMAEIVGIRLEFVIIGAILLSAFFLSLFFIKEEFTATNRKTMTFRQVWELLPYPNVVLTMIFTSFVMQISLMSIQPIITVYVDKLSTDSSHIILISGLVFSAPGLAGLLLAARVGRLADRIGPERIILVSLIFSGLLFIPQAMVENHWQLMGLRFLLGVSTAGQTPAINTLIKKVTPNEITGRVFGYNQAAQFMGTFTGAIMGGEIAYYFGIENVFYFTSTLLLLNGLWLYKKGYAKSNQADK